MKRIDIDVSKIKTKENLQLLIKYLTKVFGKEKAQQLIQQNKRKSEEKGHDYLFGSNSLAYHLGFRNMEFFCKFFLQDYFVPKENNAVRPLAQVHLDIWKELEEMFINHVRDKEVFELPRGSAKTTIIDMALCCYLSVYKQSRFTIVMANRELDAINFVDQTKKALKNDYIKYTFGELVQPRKRTVNKLELELDNDTKISAYSSGSSVRGASYVAPDGIFRPTVYIADDFVSEIDILTPDAKQRKYLRWQKEVEEGGDEAVYRKGKLHKPATKFLVLGTPLAKGDFMDQLKANPEYKTFHRSVVDFDVDEYFQNHEHWQRFKKILFNNQLDDSEAEAKEYYYEHKAEMDFPTIWEKFQPVNLAIKYFNKRIAFMQELMCDIQNVGDKWFKSHRTESQNNIEKESFQSTLLAIDTAGVKNKNKSSGDYFAFALGSIAENNFTYVRKAELLRFNEFDDYINCVIDYLEKFEDCNTVYIEKNTYNGLDVERIENEIAKNENLKNRGITFINEMQRKNKDEKISTTVDPVSNGRVIFCKERVQEEFIDQVLAFQGQKYSAHDDAPDCLSELVNRLQNIEETNHISILDRSVLF